MVHAVIDRSSVLTVNSEEHVVLSCGEQTAMVPNSNVIWLKDGVKLSKLVRFITTHHMFIVIIL